MSHLNVCHALVSFPFRCALHQDCEPPLLGVHYPSEAAAEDTELVSAHDLLRIRVRPSEKKTPLTGKNLMRANLRLKFLLTCENPNIL